MIGDKKVISLCISVIHDVSCHKFIMALNNCIVSKGYRILVFATCLDLYWNRGSESGECAVYDLIPYEDSEAIIIYGQKLNDNTLQDHIIRRAHECGKPVIVTDSIRSDCINVNFDYAKGFESVVRHVMDVHRPESVHFMAGFSGNSYSDTRKEVFRRVVEEKGFAFDESMVSYGDFWTGPTILATEKLIEEDRVPRAIICANDVMAVCVCEVLQKHHFSVPEDVIVTGFDGNDLIYFSQPSITSCDCSYTWMGEKISELLEQAIQGKIQNGQYLVNTRLIRGRSCGCRQHYSGNVGEYLNQFNNRFQRFQNVNLDLAEVTTRIQTCESVEEAAKLLGHGNLPEMCFLVNKNCLDETIDPMKEISEKSFEEEMCLIYDSLSPEDPPRDFAAKNLLPRLKERLDKPYPVAIMALNYLNIPFGYVCFQFTNEAIDEYCMIPQTVNAFNDAIGSFRNLRYQRYLVKKIDDMYKLDNLTGLYNRNGFYRVSSRLLEEIRKKNGTLTMILADLDHLKSINDLHGHEEGDAAIKAVADALVYACPEEALCARFGGDEMLAFLDGVVEVQQIKDRVKEFLAKYNRESGKPYRVSASVGVYEADARTGVDLNELFRRADLRMYAEKNKGK